MQNLVKHKRRITIRTSRKGEYVEITVEDTGPGISAETAERLFDTFFTTKKKGMGMGLAVCRSIIEHHGGTIGTAPSPGRGATFRFTLPLHKEFHRSER